MSRKRSSSKQPAATNRRTTLSGSLAILVAGSLTLAAPFLIASKNEQKKNIQQSAALAGLPAMDLTTDEAIGHALNRLGYGPRPGDIERAKQMGLAKWIDQQLHPESLDDSALDARLNRFPTLTMSSSQLENKFPRPQVAAKREGLTVQEYQKEQQEKLRATLQAAFGDDSQTNSQGETSAQGQMTAPQDTSIGTDAPVTGNRKDAKNLGVPANAMKDLERINNPQRIVAELAMAKVDRSIFSERQLYEQMVDFWFNHFNVYAGKGADRWLLTSYERDAIRPHAMGKFRDLLEATAKSPAMLFYLDNWQSVDPEAWARLQQKRETRQARLRPFFGGIPTFNAGQKKQERGLNENYGRELMELHTLGVDGGYTQDDVIAVARAFTGWTIREPQRNAEFWFNDQLHDDKPKTVLGRTINAGGMKDGEAVLDLLARDPHTAHHLSVEIARQFVSDNPPDALVDRMAKTYLATDGDIRAVLHTMIYSPEFWSRDAYRAKIKTPFELVVSAARAVGADADLPLQLVQWTGRIGEPLYQCQPPTGYSTKAETWVNTGALLNRLNYSLSLAGNRLRGVSVDTAMLLGPAAADQPDAALDRAIAALLSGEVSSQTRQTLEKQMNDPQILQASLDDPVKQINQGLVAGLVLGSPEFQRR